MQNIHWFLRVLHIRPTVFGRGGNLGATTRIPEECNKLNKQVRVAGYTIPVTLIIIILLMGIPMCLLAMVAPVGESILFTAKQEVASGDYAALTPPITDQNPCSPAAPLERQAKIDSDYSILSASLSYQAGETETVFPQSTITRSSNVREVKIEASVNVLGGGLTLTPPSNQSHWKSGEHIVVVGDVELVIPIFIVTDSTGLGSGWHLNVRSDNKDWEHARLNCLHIVLSNEDIEKLVGNQKPASLIILPTRLDRKDQVLALAAPGEGMGKFAIAPVLSDQPDSVDTGPIVVNLIASP
jgi:hypothetical protein